MMTSNDPGSQHTAANPPTYDQAWRLYRQWRTHLLVSVIVLLGVGLSAPLLNRLVFAVPPSARFVFYPLIFAPAGVALLSAFRLRFFR